MRIAAVLVALLAFPAQSTAPASTPAFADGLAQPVFAGQPVFATTAQASGCWRERMLSGRQLPWHGTFESGGRAAGDPRARLDGSAESRVVDPDHAGTARSALRRDRGAAAARSRLRRGIARRPRPPLERSPVHAAA